MACCLKEDDAKRLADKKTKGDKEEESNRMNLNPTVKKLIKGKLKYSNGDEYRVMQKKSFLETKAPREVRIVAL